MSNDAAPIDLQDYEERKFAELRPLMLFAAIFGGFFAFGLWVWDYAVDSIHALETFGWRGVMAGGVWLFCAGYLYSRLPRKWYFLSVTVGIWTVLFGFAKIARILDQGEAYGTGGYIFGEVIPLIMTLGLPRRQALTALALISLCPYFLTVANVINFEHIGVISAYLLPTFGMCAALAFFIDYLLMRVYLSRKQVEEEQDRYRMLTEVAVEGISISADGVVLDANSQCAKMFGYSGPEEMKGQRMMDMIAPESREFVRTRSLEHLQDAPYEYVALRKDGKNRFFEAFGKYTTYKGQKVRISSIRDITERKRAEAELKSAKETAERATQLKDKFVSLVAHDLRSPFGSILGFLQILKNDKEGSLSDEQKRMMEIVLASGRNLHQMIEDLLTISRLQSGKISVQNRFSNLYSLALDAALEYKVLSKDKGVDIRLNIPGNSVVFADEDLLKVVLRNLVSNAVKFTPAGGHVDIFVPDGRSSSFAVRDTGVGISPSRLETIFSYEEKTSTPGTGGELGTGLGLPLTKDIIAAHNGSITVESSPGKGSVFKVEIPAPPNQG